MEFQSINQKIVDLNMKDQYPQGSILNEQEDEWKEANNSLKENRSSTKGYKFQLIYTSRDHKEDDKYTIDLQINNLATQNM